MREKKRRVGSWVLKWWWGQGGGVTLKGHGQKDFWWILGRHQEEESIIIKTAWE